MDRINQSFVTAFASVLRDARLGAGLTQEDLAERADVSVRFISFLETGRRQPSLSALVAVSQGLGIKTSALMIAVEHRMENSASQATDPALLPFPKE